MTATLTLARSVVSVPHDRGLDLETRLDRHCAACRRGRAVEAEPTSLVSATARVAVWPAVEVRQVTSAAELTAFIRFPHEIYANDPQWVPPLEVEVRDFLNPRKHPFFRHGAAATFLAWRDGRVVGRILASDDPHYNAEHGDNVGCFGMFECIDDQQVANALFNQAAAWLAARGRTRIMGPIDYSTNYATGLLVDGFDTPPRVWMNHQPTYYSRLFAGWGLAKAKDLNAWWFDDQNDILDKWSKLAERLAKRSGVTIRPVRLDDFEAEVARCLKVYNEAWEEHWGFVKMTTDEFRHLASQLRRAAVPELVLLAEVHGEPVGFSLTLPDFNEAIKPTGGRLTRWGLPIGLAKLWWNSRRIQTARMAVLGVTEGFRGRGIAELLILKTLDYGKNVLRYRGAELSWTLEDNTAVNRTIENVGGRAYKRYRIFERGIG